MKNKKLVLILVILGSLFYFVANFQRTAIPGAVFDILEQELNLTAPYITAFGSIYMYVYAISQLIIGIVVDRYGGLKTIYTGAVILALGCIIFPLTSNIPLMYLSRVFIGVGSSCFYLSMVKELKNLFSDKNYGIAISVMLFIGYLGGIVANAPFVFLMKHYGWHDILLTIGFFVVVCIVVFGILFKKLPPRPIYKNSKLRLLPFKMVLHKKHNRNLISFACCNFGIFYVIQTVIGKKFLEDFCGYSPAYAGTVLSIMAIIAAAFNIINASVCKLCHNHRVIFLKTASIITFCAMLTICICIFFGIKSIIVALIFCILAGNASLTSLLIPVLNKTNQKMFSTTAVSIMNFCFFTMVGILGTLTGFILNVFEPVRNGNTLVYNNNSYLTLFGIFLLLSMFEVFKASKLSNKY